MRLITLPRLAVALVLVDLLVVVLHLLHVQAGASAPDLLLHDRLRINRDRGLAELLGYVQTLSAAGLLTVIYWRLREPLALAWAFVLFIVVADDAFFLHERGGISLADAWDLPNPGGLTAVDAGELSTWAILGAICLAALLLAARASSARERRATRPLVAAFLALIFFAVLVDMVHAGVGTKGTILGIEIDPAISLIEASGELFSMTAILLAAAARYCAAAEPQLT